MARAKVEVAYGGQALGDERLSRPAPRPAAAAGAVSCGWPCADVAAAQAGGARNPRLEGAAPAARVPAPPGPPRRGAPPGARSGCGRAGPADRPGTRSTVIAHRSIAHIQNRSRGRSNRVSRVHLEDPVVADDDRPRVVAGAVRVAGDLRRDRACPGTPPSASLTEDRGQRRPDPRLDLGESTRRRAPRPRSGCAARPQRLARSGRRSRRDGGPPSRPGRSRASPGSGRAPGDGLGMAATIASAVWVVRRSGEWTISRSGADRDGQRRRVVRVGEAFRDEPGLAHARRGDSGVSAWPWNRPSTMNSTPRGGRGRGSRRARPG